MKLIPLGGAEEVGATCTLFEIGGHKILVDAGIRIGQPDSLPDLGRITDFGGIEAILVTHAHTDHTGALPVVHRAYPNVPIYATPGTQAIVNVLFNDALNIMKSRYSVDREVPLYSREMVDSLFTRMQPVQLGQTIKLFGGDLAATFFPAGHILGAACIGLQSNDNESIFISGDISVTPQLTVGGMLPPVSVDKRFRPQVVMVESTYGNRMHANRATEERRLVETVAEVVESGGRVLIPAFAVGRAQEVLLILAHAMSHKVIPSFPVWVDGMVRSVCGVYTQHPYDLNTALRRQIIKNGNPFYGGTVGGKEADFESINTPDERQKLAENTTAGCIVASSGMLSGGPSSFYAKYIVKESKSAIFITGYQDEESPGRALLALAETSDPAERVLKLDGESIKVDCRVGKYSLSAHVDAGEVAGLIEQLNPQETVLVHGAGGAREALSELLMQAKERRVYLPKAADELNFAGRKNAAKKREVVAAAEQVASSTPTPVTDTPTNPLTETDEVAKPEVRPPLPGDAEELKVLRNKLVEQLGPKVAQTRSLTAQEIAQLWLAWQGVHDAELTTEEYNQFRAILNQRGSGFVSDVRRPFLYRMEKVASEAVGKDRDKDKLPLHQQAALAIVDEIFPPALISQHGLYKRGAVVTDRKIALYFYFPVPAAQKYQAKIVNVAARTGWSVELNTEAHQAALVEAVNKFLPPSVGLVKPPAIFRELQEVRAQVVNRVAPSTDEAQPETAESTPPDFAQIGEAYKEATGYKLQLALAGQVTAGQPGQEQSDSRMEINSAFGLLDRVFFEEGTRLLKRSLKYGPEGQYIELTFVTAEYGERYLPLIFRMEGELGWPLKLNPEPHQQALRDATERILTETTLPALTIKKFGLHRDRHEVALKIEVNKGTILDENALRLRFYELTGWEVRIEVEERAVAANAAPIKDTQIQMIIALLLKKGWDKATFERQAGKPIEQLSRNEASKWIDQLTRETKGMPNQARIGG